MPNVLSGDGVPRATLAFLGTGVGEAKVASFGTGLRWMRFSRFCWSWDGALRRIGRPTVGRQPSERMLTTHFSPGEKCVRGLSQEGTKCPQRPPSPMETAEEGRGFVYRFRVGLLRSGV